MIKFLSASVLILLFTSLSYCQVQRDLDKSVPLWLTYESDNTATLNWIGDNTASNYTVSMMNQNLTSTSMIRNLDGSAISYDLGPVIPGQLINMHLDKDGDANGIISLGLEIPITHERGQCLIAIDKTLSVPLTTEIEQLMMNIAMDGWKVDTIIIDRTAEVTEVKAQFRDWHNSNNPFASESKSILLLGHIPIPYSGDSAYDGHTNHQGAWVADSYYGDMNGIWTDTQISNTTPARDANKNVPGDGKFDQSRLPSAIEIEVGRVDFNDLPAFDLDEVELTRQYLEKNHRFRTGQMDYPRRAFVDNNFPSFEEGFGQTGWKSFPTLFTADSVSIQNYDVLIDEKYLCTYGCGAGSYTSAGGIGNTEDVWVNRDNQTVFTYLFGSYFGDWDITNNFLRSSLASGDVLTNCWAGRPTWHVFPMALGKHIGYCTRLTQNATDEIYGQGFAFQTAHISLLGDPTLRLHPVKPISGELHIVPAAGDIELSWDSSPEATEGYAVYRRIEGEESWSVLEEYYSNTFYIDSCYSANTEYSYMVKAIRLEHTGSGSYYNMSQGVSATMQIGDNPIQSTFYLDADGDGFGNPDMTIVDCFPSSRYVANQDDCDDMNPNISPVADEVTYNGLDDDCDPLTLDDDLDQDGFLIEDDCDDTDPHVFPGAVEIPDNGIDEDCDGMDLITNSTNSVQVSAVRIFPNPARNICYIESSVQLGKYSIVNLNGQEVANGSAQSKQIDLSDITSGVYVIRFELLSTDVYGQGKLVVLE